MARGQGLQICQPISLTDFQYFIMISRRDWGSFLGFGAETQGRLGSAALLPSRAVELMEWLPAATERMALSYGHWQSMVLAVGGLGVRPPVQLPVARAIN